MSWRGREARVAAYRGKMHWKKSGPGITVARGEFGELTRGELTRFYCITNRQLPRRTVLLEVLPTVLSCVAVVCSLYYYTCMIVPAT